MCPTSLIVMMSLSASFVFAVGAQRAIAAAGLSADEAAEGFVSLFDGKTLHGWQGSTEGYAVQQGTLVCKKHGGGNLFTEKEYTDFILRLQYKLEPGGNNGVAVRSPLEGIPAFVGIEIQILDDSFPAYQRFKPEQYNGSVYGAVAAERRHLKPPGQWNSMEILAKGSRIKVTLNGHVILDTDLDTVGPRRIHNHDLTGLHRRKGYIGLLGHGHRVQFRNLRIKEL